MRIEPNLWRASSTERVVAPALTADSKVDLAIIGGGFSGCAAALEAARMGASVCLFEAETIGHGGSGRNVGLANAGLWLPPETIVAQMGEAAGRRLIDRLGAGPAEVFALIEREGIECEPVRNGTLHLAHSAAGLRDLEDRFRQGKALGAPLTLLDAAETARRTGSRAFHGALHDARAGTIQPLSYARGLARAAVAAGARLHERTPVTALARRGDRWIVTAAGHTIEARAVLVTTNAYQLAPLAGFRPAFTAVSYCQYATDPLPEALRREILPGGEGCWDTAQVMSSVRTDLAGRLIIGGIGRTDGPSGPIHAAWARRKLAAIYPALKGRELRYGWHGRIAMTSDHVPKIVDFGPDALACFGYSGRGIAPGTVFGTEAARALLGGPREALPVVPVAAHAERLTALRGFGYEIGVSLIHATACRT